MESRTEINFIQSPINIKIENYATYINHSNSIAKLKIPPLQITNSDKKISCEKKNKQHLSNYSDPEVQSDESTIAGLFCEEHKNNVKLNCRDCKKNLCLTCLKKHHLDGKKHEYLDIFELKNSIVQEAENLIEELDGKESNLQPQFNLDEIQIKGLGQIEESKQMVINFVEEFFNELAENFNSLTSKYSLANQKKIIIQKVNDLREALKKFQNNNFPINLVNEYLKVDYKKEVESLQGYINSFIAKINKEYKEFTLPQIKINKNALEKIKNNLLDFIQIEILNKESRLLTQNADQAQVML